MDYSWFRVVNWSLALSQAQKNAAGLRISEWSLLILAQTLLLIIRFRVIFANWPKFRAESSFWVLEVNKINDSSRNKSYPCSKTARKRLVQKFWFSGQHNRLKVSRLARSLSSIEQNMIDFSLVKSIELRIHQMDAQKTIQTRKTETISRTHGRSEFTTDLKTTL